MSAIGCSTPTTISSMPAVRLGTSSWPCPTASAQSAPASGPNRSPHRPVGISVCQKAKELAAGGVEGTLFGFGLAMRQQRPAVAADEVENDLLDWPPPELAVHLQLANDLTAKSPDVVAVLTQSLVR